MGIKEKTMLLQGKSFWAKKQLLILLALIFSLNTFAVAGDGNQQRIEELDRFAYSGPAFARDRHSLDEFRSLGKVITERHKRESNPYDPTQENQFVELVFNGLLIYGRLDKETLRLIRVKITGSKWNVQDGLNVGAAAARIKKKLGMPTKQSPASQEYCGETECVYFFTKGGRLPALSFYTTLTDV